jgi:hypothetical protein
MAKIETFNLNEDLMLDYDYDGHNDLDMGSFVDIRLVVGSISTPNAPSSSKSIAIESVLDPEIEIAWELLKTELTLN